MFIESWSNIKNKIKENGIKLLITIIIIAILISGTDIYKENFSNKNNLKVIPFIYAIIFMFCIKCSLNLYEKKFEIRKVFAFNLFIIFKFLIGFVLWSLAVEGVNIIIKNGESLPYKIGATLYLVIIAIKLLPMFFYIIDNSKKYNPIKAIVRSIIETNGKLIQIFIFLLLNLIIITPVYLLKDIIGDLMLIEVGDVNKMYILESIIIGILDSVIFIFLSMHLSYLYKVISGIKIERRSVN